MVGCGCAVEHEVGTIYAYVKLTATMTTKYNTQTLASPPSPTHTGLGQLTVGLYTYCG